MNYRMPARWIAAAGLALGGTILTIRSSDAQSIVMYVTTTDSRCVGDESGYMYAAHGGGAIQNPYTSFEAPFFCSGAASLEPAAYSSIGLGSTAEYYCDSSGNWANGSGALYLDAPDNPNTSAVACEDEAPFFNRQLKCTINAPQVNGCPPNNTITAYASPNGF
jgi:hypothetical protein